MREKLIELFFDYQEKYNSLVPSKDGLADHLLANGVIVLPCGAGQEVWISGHRFPAEIECINITESGIDFEYAEYERSPEITELWDDGTFEIEDIGKTVFLTREEAESASKEGQG